MPLELVDIQNLLTFHRAALQFQSYLLQPSIVYMIEQTVKALEELHEIKEKA